MNTRTKCRNCCQKIFNEYLESNDKVTFLNDCELQHYEQHSFIFDYLLFEAKESLRPYETKYNNSTDRHSKLSDKEKQEIKDEYLVQCGYKRLISQKIFQKDSQKYTPLDDYVLDSNEVKSFLIDLQSSSSARHYGLLNVEDSEMVDGDFKKFIEKIDLYSNTLPSKNDIPIFFQYCIDKLSINFVNYWELACEYQSVMGMFFPSTKISYQKRVNYLKRKLDENHLTPLDKILDKENVSVVINADQITTIKAQQVTIGTVQNSQFYIARLEGMQQDPTFQMSKTQFKALKEELSALNDETKWVELKTILENIQEELISKEELLPFLADCGISVANNLSASVLFVFLNYFLMK